jgi:hypothetical protein
MSAQLNRFMNDMRMRLPGALDDAIKWELFYVLDDFCKETNAWQEKIILPVAHDVFEYEIEPEENRARIVRLLAVTAGTGIDERPIYDATLPEPELLVLHRDPGVPPEGTVNEYNVLVALTVVDPVDAVDILPDFPDWFFIHYKQEITDGVLARMMSQPAKPYFSREGFMYHGRKFRNGMSRARVAVNHQNTYGTQRWSFPRFAQCDTR